jgi:uncharacterized protein YcnI
MSAELRPHPRVLPPLRTAHRRASIAAVVASALAVVPPAAAHVTARPPFVEAGVRTSVFFETPNERAQHATTSLELQAPTGFEVEARDPPPGWSVDVDGRTARWTGGRIEGTSTVAFQLELTARTRAGLETFRAVQAYDDGQTVEWKMTLTVLPASAEEAPSQRLGRALAAGAVGLAVIGGSLLVLRRLPAK